MSIVIDDCRLTIADRNDSRQSPINNSPSRNPQSRNPHSSFGILQFVPHPWGILQDGHA